MPRVGGCLAVKRGGRQGCYAAVSQDSVALAQL